MTMTANAIEELIAETHRNNGLAPVDLETFWEDQDIAAKDPFGENIPQVPLQVNWGPWCIFDELGIPSDNQRYETDPVWACELNRQYNGIAETIVGRRLYYEMPPDPALAYPVRKDLHHIFEAEEQWHADSRWLMPVTDNADELQRLLDRVDKRLENLREFILPPEWDAARERLLPQGIRPKLFRSMRGPATFAQSLYGTENLIFLIMDEPAIAERFRDCIQKAIVGLAELIDAEAGYSQDDAPHGFGFNDDGCMFLTPDMYELFGLPICKAVFDRYSPSPEDRRYQHSDSPMAHLLPILSKLDHTEVNFGPTLTVSEIRAQLPQAIICGQLHPRTLETNDLPGLAAEFLRDFEQARDHRGLRFQTSGVVNNSSRLTSMRFQMAVIQRFGRY